MTFGSNFQVILFLLTLAIPFGAAAHIGWLVGQEMTRGFFAMVARVADKIKSDAKATPVKRGRGRPRKLKVVV